MDQLLGSRPTDANVVEYVGKDGSKFAMWFLNGDARQLARIECSSTSQGKEVVDSIETRLEEYHEGGVIFPKSMLFQRRVDDKLVIESRQEIVAARFNYGIDQEKFSIKSMNLEPGTPVVGNPGPTLRWNGNSLEQFSAESLGMSIPRIDDAEYGPWRSFFIGANALVAVLLLVLYVKRRRSLAD
jgi:hypothetical protein